jgi:hypothetical protein
MKYVLNYVLEIKCVGVMPLLYLFLLCVWANKRITVKI